MQKHPGKWKFAVDRGGTFTDVVGVDPEGSFHTLKLLSQSSEYEDASIEGIRRLLCTDAGEALPEDIIAGIRFGTTVATNALLERKGGRTALLITKGFSDLLEIGYQDRPEIFRLCIQKSTPVYSMLSEVDERIDYKGKIINSPDLKSLSVEADKLIKANVDAVAVVLMHSWINPGHETLCENVLREKGISNIFLSHKAVNLIKIISRGQSTLVDAYLSTVLFQYIDGIKNATGGIPIEFMQSNGALSSPGTFTGKNALFSGPAGGVIAVAGIADSTGIKGVVGFDMGGTSTDVSRFDGEFRKIYEQKIAGIPLQVEMMDIITVAAGGGSILKFDGQKMTAGPESAGSYPGPACYGYGGPLTVTDANLFTGRLVPEYFPRTFGPDKNTSLDYEIAQSKFISLANEINSSMETDLSPRDIASGFLRIADEKMAMAIREISVSRGFDVRDYALVCFGGAGGQHACSIATLLDIQKVIIHPLSGVMSAYGIGMAKPARKSSRTILKRYDGEYHKELADIFREVEQELFPGDESYKEVYQISRTVDLRPQGAETFLSVAYGDFEETVNTFKDQYKRLFGFHLEDTPLEVMNIRVEAVEERDFITCDLNTHAFKSNNPEPLSFQDFYYAGGDVKAPVYKRESLPAGTEIGGTAVIIDSQFTVVVETGFKATADDMGMIIMTRTVKEQKHGDSITGRPDPVLLEVFNNIFMGIATEMGLTLKNTAYSVNMKERLDYSCAIFDREGDLVANAPHIPVHLGSMGDTVKAIIQDKGESMRSGDTYLTNNPYRGGSHLSDMTVICPVYSDDNELIFFTAARGHHSDVGGTTPGSMPPDASHIDEEGVLVDGLLLVRGGVLREEALREALLNHTYPVRNVEERIFDFRAQTAACHKGMKELMNVMSRYGLNTVTDYMKYIQDNAEYSVKAALSRFLGDGGSFYSMFEDNLDDGTPIRASVSIEGGPNPPETVKAAIDLSGTGPEHTNDNLNAPRSVVRSAELYVLRALIDKEIPLNSGCLKPVEIIIPSGTILSPVYPAPVASGNVETSQRVVDALLGALGITAASQGTMNNLLFEAEGEAPYYETIAGGAGAMEGCPGASGVQVHMTNTRMTDPEVLEFRHPGVRIERFTLRKGSGGKGVFPGGDGVIRELKFFKPATVSIISERRSFAPYGMEGGGEGKRGVNIYRKSDGSTHELKHRDVLKVSDNESIVIKTPGGGGYGKAG